MFRSHMKAVNNKIDVIGFMMVVALVCLLTPRSYGQTRTMTNADTVAQPLATGDKTMSEAPGPSGQTIDPEIPPAVQKQLRLMQLRIDQLQRQLDEKGRPAPASALVAEPASADFTPAVRTSE